MSSDPKEFIPPADLAEAETRRKQLTLDVQSIQTQLGDRQRTNEDGSRLSSKDYWTWNKKAKHSLNCRLHELRNVKQWIWDQGTSNSETRGATKPATLDEAIGHIQQLHTILINLRKEEVEFDENERVQIDAARDFLAASAETP